MEGQGYGVVVGVNDALLILVFRTWSYRSLHTALRTALTRRSFSCIGIETVGQLAQGLIDGHRWCLGGAGSNVFRDMENITEHNLVRPR